MLLRLMVIVACCWVACDAAAQSEGSTSRLSISPGTRSDALPQSMRDATAELDRLDGIAQQSSDLRTRAMLAWRNPLPAFPQGSAALVSLSAEAAESTDPVVLMMLATGCDAPQIGCDPQSFATRWSQIDADNGAAWLTLWAIDTRLGDTSGAELALAQATAAADWHDYTVELTHTFVAVVPDDAEVLVRLVARLQSAPHVVGVVNAMYREALALCRLPSKQEACTALTDLIAREPVSLLQATVAASLSKNFGAPAAVVAVRRERVEAWQWAIAQNQPGGLLTNDPRENAAQVIAYVDDLNLAGEAAAAKRELAEKHLSEAQAAARYRQAREAAKSAEPVSSGPLLPPVGSGLHAPTH
jgi:hypothetical protein